VNLLGPRAGGGNNRGIVGTAPVVAMTVCREAGNGRKGRRYHLCGSHEKSRKFSVTGKSQSLLPIGSG